MKARILLRRSSQFIFLSLFIHILWSAAFSLKDFLPSEAFVKTDPLIMIFTSVSERVILPGIAFSIAMLVLTLIFGRFFCGWVCPLGSIIDLTGGLGGRMPARSDSANKGLRKAKFFVLAAIVFFALSGHQLAWVFDPIVVTTRFILLNLIPSAALLSDRSGAKADYFLYSGIVFLFFLVICYSALFVRRLWCRAICPLGALYSLFAKRSLLRRVTEKCDECKICPSPGKAGNSGCRMGAIKDDASYVKEECVLCMDCLYDCPKGSTRFIWPAAGKNAAASSGQAGYISRRNFITLSLSSVFLAGFAGRIRSGKSNRRVIRPPAALDEKEFVERCIRCGSCEKVCVTGGLQPVIFESGLEGIWTPRLVPEIGYCDYNCALCGRACPTGAIRRISLRDKRRAILGLAEIDRATCVAWAENQHCLVCKHACPVSGAIKIKEDMIEGISILKPLIDKTLCIGCGICQNKCPARPVRAVRVFAS
jgi:polyferredoxin/formate hydrogenlyase subunit 6/NADH:ubiquinone oxidoreductase subunit I